MDDKSAAEFYADPANRRMVGPGRRRAGQGRLLSNHVPVRFAASMIARIRTLAARDGLTVSSWVRKVVEREVERRMPVEQVTTTSAWTEDSTVTLMNPPHPGLETDNPAYESQRVVLEHTG